MVTQELRHVTPSLREQSFRICPCCGFKFAGDMADGCGSCGAQSVGEALPRPEHELPSFGRSLLLTVVGALMVLSFLTQTIIAYVQKGPASISFWALVAAAETAAWRLKWVVIPVSILVLWAGRKIYRSMMADPERFCGLRYARSGFVASAFVPALIVLLIGVTVPERLSQLDRSVEHGFYARGYRIDRALLDYRTQFGTLPADLKDLSRLTDSDGSLAAALSGVDATAYKATADLASLPAKKSPQLRGAVIMKASLSNAADDLPSEGVSFTNYELPLAGKDKLLGTEDDLIVRDGIIYKASEAVRRSTKPTK